MTVTKKSLINGLAVLMLGAALGYMVAQKRCRPHWYGNHADKEAFYLSIYTDKLSLSPEQQEQAREIISKRSKNISAVMKEMRPKFKEVREQSDLAMREILNEQQQVEFTKLQAKFDERRKKRWGKNRQDSKSE